MTASAKPNLFMPINSSRITFVIPVARRDDILRMNILASPDLRNEPEAQVLVQEGFSSAGLAFNDALDKAINDLVVFLHSDIFLPHNWVEHLGRALNQLSTSDPNWGVLGCWGSVKTNEYCGHIYSNGLGILGEPFDGPRPVRTLDETVLILRKSSGLRFDCKLPHFHLHGTDVCLTAHAKGMATYAIPAFCIHNNDAYSILPREFYDAYAFIRKKWWNELPIETPCIKITSETLPKYRRKLRDLKLRYIDRREFLGRRSKHPELLLNGIAPLIQTSPTHDSISRSDKGDRDSQ